MNGPTTLLRGGRVLVGAEPAPRPAELLLRDGLITSIARPGEGGHRQVDEVIELDGRVVLPGFVDGHCHLELTAVALEFQLPLHTPPYESIAQMLAALDRARAAQPLGWIIARSSFGLQNKVAEGRLPHRFELDKVSPGQPMAVLAGLHVACLNSAAITSLGLDHSARLPGWISQHHDANGPTGAFTEVWDRLPTAGVDDVVAALRAHAIPVFSRSGVTSLSTIPTSADDVRALHRLAKAGELPFRVRFYPHVPRTATLDEVLAWGPESGFGDEWLRFGGVKIFVDGEGADAVGNPRDDTKWTQRELYEFVRRADAAGVQVMMHAVTPGAVRFACEAALQARQANGGARHVRHRVEHAGDYMDPADAGLATRAAVGLVATPHFATSSDPDAPDFQPLRALIDAGHRIIGATDCTGTVPEAASPLVNIAAAVGRAGSDGKPSPHRISVVEGIRMFSRWSALGAAEEHEKGTIAPGLRADLVVLDDDPFTVPPDRIATIAVDRTIVAGLTVSGTA
ncbi:MULTISPECIES: amidohydrolase [unclassified Mycolicibacterium]|uniref:amidohydrolase n=1 Tax=unclassified Mycolicibacterium TaxID=2636767 RepID=UPI0012DFD517|nr:MULTISPECIES: amidohydrolase family protein [unclassified Mycolicibacterium]MUL85928.1 amidohydrolase family protein [Mycolicibacterium sp. CBMA 329]MUL91696.1 amidohydrolase family protein [Mycolicibacterium sp. CBMA 331]MUM03147.1 amidohydrolase family protein [Mycolicibacterium sp. CBMA 334]MUM29533.1 amidohydrolase family protein [Mycolicibacterium sp. CBMA 295]MUM41991.1 amidohydrolase family protein [Mycolicibacterium sp. CBMA 247]